MINCLTKILYRLRLLKLNHQRAIEEIEREFIEDQSKMNTMDDDEWNEYMSEQMAKAQEC